MSFMRLIPTKDMNMYLDINVTTLIEGNESVDGMVIVDKFDN